MTSAHVHVQGESKVIDRTTNTRPIRVAHIHAGKTMCGCASYIFRLFEGMKGSPFEMHLALLMDGEVAQAAKERGVPYFVAGRGFPGDPRTFFSLRRYFREQGIDIIHTHTINSNFYGRMASLIPPRLPVVTTVHTYLKQVYADVAPDNLIKQRFLLWQNRKTHRLASAFVIASERLRHELIDQEVRDELINIVFNGIPIPDLSKMQEQAEEVRQELELDPQVPVIATAIRFVPSKNVAGLIRAAGYLRDQECPATLLLIGEGPERDDLERLTDELKLRDRVRFLGWQKNVPRLMSAVDIYVQPSFVENFPYAIMEAMAAGKPVVAYETGSHGEIIVDGHNGRVIENSNQQAFNEAIRELAADPDMRSAFGKASRERSQELYSAEGMGRAMGDVYRRVFEANRPDLTSPGSEETTA